MIATMPALIGITSGRNQSALVKDAASMQFPGIAPRGGMLPMKTSLRLSDSLPQRLKCQITVYPTQSAFVGLANAPLLVSVRPMKTRLLSIPLFLEIVNRSRALAEIKIDLLRAGREDNVGKALDVLTPSSPLSIVGLKARGAIRPTTRYCD
jgi:hypothetical protein